MSGGCLTVRGRAWRETEEERERHERSVGQTKKRGAGGFFGDPCLFFSPSGRGLRVEGKGRRSTKRRAEIRGLCGGLAGGRLLPPHRPQPLFDNVRSRPSNFPPTKKKLPRGKREDDDERGSTLHRGPERETEASHRGALIDFRVEGLGFGSARYRAPVISRGMVTGGWETSRWLPRGNKDRFYEERRGARFCRPRHGVRVRGGNVRPLGTGTTEI